VTNDEGPDPAALSEERRRARELRASVDLACAVLRQEPMSREEAEALVASVRRRALALFPGKAHVFDLVLAPRFRRIIDEVLPPARSGRILPFRGRRP
jgi:hypothetical protein